MKYAILGKNIELTPDIRVYVAKKMGMLNKYVQHFGSVAAAHVEVGRTTRHHRTGAIFRVEIQIHVPRKELRAEALGNTIFEAIDKAKDEISIELEQHKEKDIDLKKRGARKLKNLIQSV